MLRRLLTLILLVPLSLNGLWMVCAEAEAAEPPAAESTNSQPGEVAKAAPACTSDAMCPLHKAVATAKVSDKTQAQEQVAVAQNHSSQAGAMCLISPGGNGTSIAAIGFLYAPPLAAVDFGTPQEIVLEAVEQPSFAYLDSELPDDTPPPRA
jgi:hypothetical protein